MTSWRSRTLSDDRDAVAGHIEDVLCHLAPAGNTWECHETHPFSRPLGALRTCATDSHVASNRQWLSLGVTASSVSVS